MLQSEEKRINKKILLGVILLLAGLVIVVLTYFPVISAYISHLRSPAPSTDNVVIAKNSEEVTKEVTKDTQEVLLDPDFGVYIPKIKSNSKVLKNISPYDKKEYLKALQTGVAHAKGTYTPDVNGNVFLFAHSAVNFYERYEYSVYFYLLGELEKGDSIFVSYEGEIYRYKVDEVKVVNKEDTKYLGNYSEKDTLTLMTCYPPGTDWKRTIVVAYRD